MLMHCVRALGVRMRCGFSRVSLCGALAGWAWQRPDDAGLLAGAPRDLVQRRVDPKFRALSSPVCGAAERPDQTGPDRTSPSRNALTSKADTSGVGVEAAKTVAKQHIEFAGTVA